jgi:spermidine synthase
LGTGSAIQGDDTSEIDVVELSSSVIEYSMAFFGLNPQRIRFFRGDALEKLRDFDEDSYDFIIHDLYSGSDVDLCALYNQELFQTLQELAKPNGVVMIVDEYEFFYLNHLEHCCQSWRSSRTLFVFRSD